MRGPSREAALRDTLGLASRLARPAGFLPPGGYGMPDGAERDAAASRLADAAAEWRTGTASLQALGEAALPAPRRHALQATRANVERLGERLRVQARDAGTAGDAARQ
jgi:hypothetical protein